MKIKLNDLCGDHVGTLEGPRHLLNNLSIALDDAAEFNEQEGYHTIAREYHNYSIQIYNQLKEAAFYDRS